MTETRKPAKRTTETGAATAAFDGFTDEERAAMKDHAQELKTAARRSGSRTSAAADDERDVLAKIAEMAGPDRAMAERVHAVITANVPELSPKLWYGMPAYTKGGKIICHFQPAQKFKTRYATLGFSDNAKLDDGAVWPVAYALPELTPEVEARISALVKQAAG
jgi:uncharacterized protein YdhG (YjbR/CyaY superfamily)